jgi:hypothetical protein
MVESRGPEHLLLPQTGKSQKLGKPNLRNQNPRRGNPKRLQPNQTTSFNAFPKLYTTSGRAEDETVDAFLRHIPSKVTEEDNMHLDRPIEEAKILKALNQFMKTKPQVQMASLFISTKSVGT